MKDLDDLAEKISNLSEKAEDPAFLKRALDYQRLGYDIGMTDDLMFLLGFIIGRTARNTTHEKQRIFILESLYFNRVSAGCTVDNDDKN